MDAERDTCASIEEVGSSLDAFRVALRADGYELDVVRVTRDSVELRIQALEGACDECLVPEVVMAPMIAAALPPSLRSASIRIHYPGKSH
jgi:Fe-S cluster biogenesis protein NfuA